MPPNNVHPSTDVDLTHGFLERLDAVLRLARPHRQHFPDIVEHLEEARTAPNCTKMDIALLGAYSDVKRHFRDTETEVILLLTARDAKRRALVAIQQQLSDLLVERFGSGFYGSPEPWRNTFSVVVLCIVVMAGMAILYFGGSA